MGDPGLWHGFTAPWRGAKLLWARRDLWPLVLAPTAITFGLLVFAIGGSVASAGPFTLWLMPWITKFPVLFFVIKLLVGGLLCMALGTLATMLGTLLALPFNDALSERVEATVYSLPAPLTVREALPTSILHSILGFGLWLLLQVILLPLQGLPGIGSAIDVIGGIAITAFFLAHQMMDGPMSRWRFSFREKLDLLWEHRMLTFGLGLASMLMLGIPVINLVCLPVCIAGGALLYAEVNPLVPR